MNTQRLVDLWKELRDRRIIQIFTAYLAGGWVALEVIDQLSEHAILPELAYRLALVIFLAGIPASLIIGWYHGERGDQKASLVEILLLLVVGAGALTAGAVVYRAETAPQTAAELGGSLDPHRIAVTYFRSDTEGDTLHYLADGLTEELIERLRDVRRLDVVSKNGVRPYRDSQVSRDSIARALSAGTLVEGVVERSPDSRIRVTTRLVDGSSGALVERASFELPQEELLALQDSVSREIARTLRRWLGEDIALRQRRRATDNLAAWTLVQRAEQAMREAETRLGQDGTEEALAGYRRADSLLAQAEPMDTTWAEPATLRADVGHERSWLVHAPHEALEWLDIGLGHANRALARDPDSGDALALRGLLLYRRYLLGAEHEPERAKALLAAAQDDLETAVERDPTQARAYSALSHLYLQKEGGSVVDALLAARQAYRQDAYLRAADVLLWRLYSEHYDLQQYSEARRWCEEGRRRFPRDHRFVECQLWLMTMPQARPDVDEAWELLEEIERLVPEPQRTYRRSINATAVAGTLARAGMADSARSVLFRAREAGLQADPDQEILFFEAIVRVILGDEEQAISLLKRYAAANPGHFEEGTSHWWWQPLQDHPEFQRFTGRGG